MKKNVIIIVSPNATRTGAQILLLTYLKWLKNNKSFNYLFFFEKGGELYSEFEKLGEVYKWEEINTFRSKIRLLDLLLRVLHLKKLKPFFDKKILNKLSKKYHCKVAISNTSINNQQQLRLLKNAFNCKIITYVHEGYKYLNSFNLKSLVTNNFADSSEIIAVSEFVKQMLISKYYQSKHITIIPGSIRANDVYTEKETLKRAHKIPIDKIIIMCCGWIGWHKGSDFFTQLLIQLSRSNNEFHFVWLGGSNEDLAYSQMMFDIDTLNLQDSATFIFSVENSLDYINLSDVFLILSREESFSLVTIEAGSLGKPILCFENSGGPCEIVRNDRRFLVPYADINALSSRVKELSNNKKEREDMGLYIKNIVEKHYQIDRNANLLFELIKKI